MTEFFADLTGVRAKLRRANEHLSSLNDELWRLSKEYADTRFIEFWCEGERQVLYYKRISHFFNIHHSLIAGDIFNNLRTALDHIIWQLVLREGKKPRQTNDFPIFTSEQDFISKVKYPSKKFERRSPLYQIPVDGDAWTIIEGAQPWFRAKTYGYDPRQDILAALALLSNIDKHRIVLINMALPDQPAIENIVRWTPSDVQPIEVRYPLWQPLSHEHSTELVRFRFPRNTDVRMYVGGRLPVWPSFGDENTQVAGPGRFVERVSQIVDQISTLPTVQG
jgi:hypothetical protein